MSNSEHNETDGIASGEGKTPDDCRLRQFERNRFFNGKLMTARDMQVEQDYHAGRLEMLAQHVTGKGIVCGLEVSIESAEESTDKPTAVVEPGLALDDCGRPIVVTEKAREEIPASVLQQDGSMSEQERDVSVFIEQATCKTESVPVAGSEDACKEECEYNRLRETFNITFKSGPPDEQKRVPAPFDPSESPSGEMSDDETEGNDIAPTDDVLQELALSYHRRQEGDPGEGRFLSCDTTGDTTVFLGHFEQQNGSWSPVPDDASEPRPYVYTNDMLYAAISRMSMTDQRGEDGTGEENTELEERIDDLERKMDDITSQLNELENSIQNGWSRRDGVLLLLLIIIIVLLIFSAYLYLFAPMSLEDNVIGMFTSISTFSQVPES